MENYFLNTPVYKLWTEYLDFICPKTNFIVEQLSLTFVNIVCARGKVVSTYEDNVSRIILYYGHSDKTFFIYRKNKTDNSNVNWKTPPPEIIPLNSKDDLQKEIEKWLDFLKIEYLVNID